MTGPTRPSATTVDPRTLKAAGQPTQRQMLAGRYLLEAELGQGGVGRVFRAFDGATRTRVALKLVRPEVAGRRRWLQRLGREVRHAREVQHPNVCRIFELVEADGFTFFTMELASPGALSAELPTTAQRPLTERLADARALAAGVAAIHAAGIVHRDLKPANVLRMADGRIVVSDFGLAVLGQREPGAPEGTWGYMAPEVIQTGAATSRSDVWALGVVMYEILFGARPMLGTRVRRPKGNPAGLEAALAELCLACCAFEPARRPADAREVSLRIEALDGETLKSLLQRERLPLPRAVRIVASALDALATLHRRKRLHGALCPANVFIRSHDSVRLLDPHADGPFAQPEADPLYLAPERARDESGVDERADIFALGCVLRECLLGAAPGAAGDLDALARRALGEKLDVERFPDATPPALTKLVSRMLAPDAKKRPRDAGQLALDLRKLAESLDGSTALTSTTRALSEEQRVICALAVDLRAETMSLGTSETAERLRETATSFEARVDWLDDARAVIGIVGHGTPTDQAAIGGRCALAVSERFPTAKVTLGIGRAVSTVRGLRGEVVDRTISLLPSAEPGKVLIDERATSAVGTHFRLAAGPRAFLAGRAKTRERPRTVLGTDTPCFGRERELAALIGLWDECKSESVARAVLVTAPAGAGKTRVRHELLERLARQGERPLIVANHGDALRAGAPFTLLGPALAEAAEIRPKAPVETQQTRLRALVSRYLPPESATRLAPVLGEIAGVRFPDDALPALQAARQNPRLMADQVTAAWLELVGAATRTGPVLLVFEDLQWGDAPSLQLVDTALRTLRERPLLVLALARPEVDSRFPRLWAERNLQRIALPPLTAKSAHRLVRHVLPAAPAEEVAWIVDRADGNPLYIEELVRAVGSDSRRPSVPPSYLPETIAGTVQARFDALGDRTKRVLRAASIFGEAFNAEGVRAVLASDDTDLDDCLENLADREIVYRRGESGDELAFRHALLQQAAYDMLAPRDRVLAHRRAAAHLVSTGEPQAILLVEHYERAGDRRRAAHACRIAAQQALEGNDLRATIARVDRALSLGPSPSMTSSLHVLAARAERWLGNFAAAERAARLAVARRRGESWFDGMNELVSAFGSQNELDAIAPLARQLARKAPRKGNKRAWLDALTSAARWLVPAGRIALASELLDTVSAEREMLSGGLAVRVFLLRGEIARMRGDLVTFVESGQAAMAICETTGDIRTLSEALMEVGCGMQELGLLEEAADFFRRSAEAKTRPGLEGARAYADSNLAFTLCLQGKLNEARAMIDRALEAAGPAGTRLRSMCEIYSSYIAHRAGELGRARHAARAAMASSRNWHAAHVQAIAMMARVLGSLGRKAQALAYARRAGRMLDANARVEDGEALVRAVLVECSFAGKNQKAARAALLLAKKCVDDRANLITNPAWRTAFRTRLPEHALIDRLAREHLSSGAPDVSSSSPRRKARERGRGAANYGPSSPRRIRGRT